MSYTLDDKPGDANSFGVTNQTKPPTPSKNEATTEEMELLTGMMLSDKTLRKRAFTTLLRAITSGRGI